MKGQEMGSDKRIGESIQKIENLYQDVVDKILIDRFGSGFAEYREKWYRVEEGGYVPDFPMNIDLEITGTCNLRCKMCARGVYDNDSMTNKGLDRQTIKKILDEAEGRSYALVLGNNDEPLLDKQKCLWTLAYAREKKFIDTFLGTNGINLSGDVIEELLRMGVSRVTISLDAASPDMYRRVRGRDEYDKIIENIELLLKKREERHSRLPVLRVTFVEMPENSSEKEEFLGFWRGKADNILIQGFLDLEREKIGLTEKEMKVLRDSKKRCWDPFRRLSVLGTGEIYPCCSLVSGIESLGNIRDISLEKAWNSGRMRQIRQLLSEGKFYEIPFCLRCGIATFQPAK